MNFKFDFLPYRIDVQYLILNLILDTVDFLKITQERVLYFDCRLNSRDKVRIASVLNLSYSLTINVLRDHSSF